MKTETNQKIENEMEFTNEQLEWIFNDKYAEQGVIWDWVFYGGLTDNVPDNIGLSGVDGSIESHLNMDGICTDSGAGMFYVYTTNERKAELADFLHSRFPYLDFVVVPYYGDEEQYNEVSA